MEKWSESIFFAVTSCTMMANLLRILNAFYYNVIIKPRSFPVHNTFVSLLTNIKNYIVSQDGKTVILTAFPSSWVKKKRQGIS